LYFNSLHLYGKEVVKLWFSNAGLQAYQDVKWDPTKKSTTSKQDHETRALVEEDLFNIGTDWKTIAPVMQKQAARQPQESNYTVQNLLQSRSNGDDVHSFMSVYGRRHEGDSIATEREADDTMNDPAAVVQIDEDAIIERPAGEDARSYDASTAGNTTGTTHEKLHAQERLVAQLMAENRELEARTDPDGDDRTIQTTKSTRDQLAEALEALARIDIMTNEANHDTTMTDEKINDPTKMKTPEPRTARHKTDDDEQSMQTTKSTRDKLAEALARIERMTAKPLERIGMMISPYPKLHPPATTEATGTEAISTGHDN
jgi:hypothetical protein